MPRSVPAPAWCSFIPRWPCRAQVWWRGSKANCWPVWRATALRDWRTLSARLERRLGARGQIGGPDAVFLRTQLVQIGPAEKATVMAVVETDAHGIIAHRL